jgi:hypothetical protein
MGQIPRLVMAEKLGRRERSDQAEEFRSGHATAAIRDGLPMKIQTIIFAIAPIAAQKGAGRRTSGLA